MSNFPGSVDSFSTKIDFSTIIDAADVNSLQSAVVAVESSLLGQTASTLTPSATSVTSSSATSATFTTATITGLTATSATATSVTATSASISAATVSSANFVVGAAGSQATFPSLSSAGASTFAMRPVVVQAFASTVTGTTNTTGVMMGLATTITPQVTGRLFAQVSGDILNSTAIADGGKLQLRAGTGTAPTNASTTLAGSTISGLVTYIAATTAEKAPFSVQGLATGLAVGTTVWIDLSLAAITGGTATIENISVSVFEL